MTARKFLKLPPAEWAGAYALLKEAERIRLDTDSAELAIAYARMSAYVSRRRLGGTHDQAVQQQNNVASGVRRALGYTVADQPIIF